MSDCIARNPATHSVRNIGGTRVLVPGHQNSGAPTFFFGVFLMVFSNLCWQCSNKTRKCQEHINTLRKKEKLIFLMPILEIKTKNLFSAGKGTRVLVPGHQNSGAPSFFLGISWWCTHICACNVLKKTGNVRNTSIHLVKRQIDNSDAHSRDYNKKPVVNLKGHQNSGALTILLVFSWLFILIYAGSVLIKQGNVRIT